MLSLCLVARVAKIYPQIRLTDKPISFEISLGNAGNSLDGQTQPGSATQNEDGRYPDMK